MSALRLLRKLESSFPPDERHTLGEFVGAAEAVHGGLDYLALLLLVHAWPLEDTTTLSELCLVAATRKPEPARPRLGDRIEVDENGRVSIQTAARLTGTLLSALGNILDHTDSPLSGEGLRMLGRRVDAIRQAFLETLDLERR